MGLLGHPEASGLCALVNQIDLASWRSIAFDDADLTSIRYFGIGF
jgi:hypothetical protein